MLPHSNYIQVTKRPTQGRATAPNIPLKALAHCKESKLANMEGSSEQNRAPPIPNFSYSTKLDLTFHSIICCSFRLHYSRTKRSQENATSANIPLRALAHGKNIRLANMDGWMELQFLHILQTISYSTKIDKETPKHRMTLTQIPQHNQTKTKTRQGYISQRPLESCGVV